MKNFFIFTIASLLFASCSIAGVNDQLNLPPNQARFEFGIPESFPGGHTVPDEALAFQDANGDALADKGPYAPQVPRNKKDFLLQKVIISVYWCDQFGVKYTDEMGNPVALKVAINRGDLNYLVKGRKYDLVPGSVWYSNNAYPVQSGMEWRIETAPAMGTWFTMYR